VSRTSTLRKQTRSTARSANKKVSPVASDARDTAVRYAETTRDWAAPKVEAAKEWAAPKVEPAVEKVKDDVVPAVAAAVTAALAASEPVRTEAAHRGNAALLALKGELEAPKPKKHRLRKLFLLAGVLGAAYAGWKAWAAQSSSGNPAEPWTTTGTYGAAGATTGTVTSVTPATTRPSTDDTAGAGPDEAIADAADESKAEDESPGGSAAGTTTEPVSPKNARKVSGAAAKGSSKPGTGS
jgi:hypothetical protein